MNGLSKVSMGTKPLYEVLVVVSYLNVTELLNLRMNTKRCKNGLKETHTGQKMTKEIKHDNQN